MRKITEKNKMYCDRDTAKMLMDIFGSKILDDIIIYNPTIKDEEVKKKDECMGKDL